MADDSCRIPFEYSDVPRTLSGSESQKMVEQNNRLVAPFVEMKLEENARKNWDIFYKRNTTKFFKDRHWTTSEFKELLGNNESLEGRSLLEVGCGVGNLIFPLLEEGIQLKIHCCDFSKRAVDFVKSHPLYNPLHVHAFEGDITSPSFCELLNDSLVNITTMVFVLSAIHPSKFHYAAKNIYDSLATGGVLLIRDYALHDMTQLRFKPGNKISDNFYMRQDGTRTYFFTTQCLRDVFLSVGFREETCQYVHCRTINKKESVDVPRTFIQAKFIKDI